MVIKRFGAICLFALMVGTTIVSAQSRCSAHCDRGGYYKKPFFCNDVGEEYCCGDKHFRYCCGNATMDISADFDDVYVCPRSSWWLYHWQIIIGLLGSIILVLLFAACCCQCCGGCKHARRRFRRADNEQDVNTVSGVVGEDGNELRVQHFDPQSPFAFNPPDYDSLPKDPPKYEEIYIEGGAENAAFAWDAPPPESARTNENAQPSSSNCNTSPRSQSGIHITTHGTAPIGELPPYEIAVLEPSSSQTVSLRNATNNTIQSGSSTLSTVEVENDSRTPITVRYQARGTEQNTNQSSSSDERL